MNHQHTCAQCGFVYECVESPCKVMKAVKTNKAGPFCQLCRYIEMAKRVASLRGVPLEISLGGEK